ncbi:MAG: segregation/condensation protein A [Oscillibacter sp.]|nr:segregation/condensation protein A [Oscillibacter sp.]
MESPVFKLEKVVRTRTEEMRDFEGPLDLILFLLSRNKMEIQDISISMICDQYLAWIAQRQSMDLEVASEFITMASQLMYIKSRMLLSIEDEEAKNEMDALIESLEERKRNESYAEIKETAARLAPLAEFGRNIVTRNPEPLERRKVYEYSQRVSDLGAALAELRSRSARSLPSPEAAFREIAQHEPYPVETKAEEILRRLREEGILRFARIFFGCRSRSEIVATFLALLELCRRAMLRLFGPMADYSVEAVDPAAPEETAIAVEERPEAVPEFGPRRGLRRRRRERNAAPAPQ